MQERELDILANADIPESIRAQMAEHWLNASSDDRTHEVELRKLEIERRKVFINTPLFAALASLITLAGTFVFDIGRAETDAAIAAAEAEREFQYRILANELSDRPEALDRAAALEFLARAGVLTSLDTSELRAMANEQRVAPTENIVPQTRPAAANASSAPIVVQPVADLAGAPGQVALVAAGTRGQFCNGVAIRPNWVLTAAHCVEWLHFGRNELEVVSGTLNVAEGGSVVSVERIEVHPNYDAATHNFDAALLELNMRLPGVVTADLVAENYESDPGDFVQVTGWGTLLELGPVSQQMQNIALPIVSRADCNRPESYGGRVSGAMLCAGNRAGGLDACRSFGGSPARITVEGQSRVVGISSWGEGCGRPNKYGVYTSVGAIRNWIDSTISAGE